MQLKTKIFLLLFSSLAVFFIFITISGVIVLRKNSLKSTEVQAHSVVKVIEAGLTAHMINGNMEHRDEFLKLVTSLDGMKNLWVVRSRKVSNQYGEGPFTEEAYDGIDKSVLESGERVIVSKGGVFEDSTVRFSYPYKATTTKEVDCLSCHDVKVGDTLGVISLEMSTNDLKTLNLYTILIGIAVLVLLFGAISYFLYKNIMIYFNRFEAIGECVRLVEKGNFSARVPESLSKDHDAASLNRLIEKIQQSIESIKVNLSPSMAINNTQDSLTALDMATRQYNSIQHLLRLLKKDTDKTEMYSHIGSYFSKVFSINDINIIEHEVLANEIDIVYEKNQILCDATSGCRAAKSLEVVDSSQPDRVCPKMISPDENYICFPCSISSTNTMVVSILNENRQRHHFVRTNEDAIKQTMVEIKGHLAQYQMGDRLKRLERIDSLTGLYNQSYLSERMFQILKESKRAVIPYGILVINVDKLGVINEVYDKKTGDETIALIGHTLLDVLRESDLVVRSSGDEFIVLLYDCDPIYSASVGERVRSLLANKKLKSHPSGIIMTVSIGSSIFPEYHKDIQECVVYARIAMAESKREGGNLVTKFHPRLLER
ncbi:MAG: GGDEF domain-containing protein [Sulfuricurvum sp.]|uniref:sensor domain-containing diguanylate cyclase n=1 Tax=Sulfuricurvum sp. TaxID=2025608 RepID=UPI00260FE994|nr:GGDEF domain-containing protein [Sulfuricurvum sp.]MDD2830013.1 GGDEF domain-containing protein [Sulfuricurvum sp.]MDD4948886.1 GGDEF domain-containing protein [Sulfuricurvum sp.]